jgi:hypothetical protein
LPLARARLALFGRGAFRSPVAFNGLAVTPEDARDGEAAAARIQSVPRPTGSFAAASTRGHERLGHAAQGHGVLELERLCQRLKRASLARWQLQYGVIVLSEFWSSRALRRLWMARPRSALAPSGAA